MQLIKLEVFCITNLTRVRNLELPLFIFDKSPLLSTFLCSDIFGLWSLQVGSIGFSIGAAKTANVSLVIGPGSGYNLKSNPLPEEDKLAKRTVGSKRPKIFQDQLRAEREAFRAVFDKRRQRIHGIDLDEE